MAPAVKAGAIHMVEAAGVEPASESGSTQTSTCLARSLDLALRVSNGRDTR